eukprot:TRINITY_DN3426_c0_g1_i1.p1 TRINITY_DN3426_c0_g1~~TRINITY_DN3426_c0_g1_i1.p1  ORF type:complete len:392 (-),score=146.22 TRINITY_DN3426_c0_g1_i1:353-1528(-)
MTYMSKCSTQGRSQLQRLLGALRHLLPASISFSAKAADCETCIATVKKLAQSHKMVKSSLSSLVESLWSSSVLLSNSTLNSIMPKGSADEQEELVLKGILERVKQAYDAQQRHRKDLEEARSKLELQKAHLQKAQGELSTATQEIERLKGDAKDSCSLKEQLVELKERLSTANEELHRRSDAMAAMRKEKMDMQLQYKKSEEKSERTTIENGLLNKKYNDAVKELEAARNECAQLKAEFGGIGEKNKILEEYQAKVSLYERQLKNRQEEIEISKSKISNMTGVIEAEEAKYTWIIKAKESEILQLLENSKQSLSRVQTMQQELVRKGELEASLQCSEAEVRRLREENQRIGMEKVEMKKYAESLLAELRRQDTNSSYLVLGKMIHRLIEEC